MINNITAFVSPTTIKPALSGVYVTPNKIVATDSFKLIEIKANTGAVSNFIVKLPKGVKTFDRVEDNNNNNNLNEVIIHSKGAKYETTKIDDVFPDYEVIIPKEEEKPLLEIRLSSKHLKAICEAFEDKKSEINSSMDISFYGKNRVVVFTNQKKDKRALLMPITR